MLSEQIVGIKNNNFTYKSMTSYVNGLGDYWVRLVEQMIPASTIWNTGVKYENSIFHRQKHAWRRQRGCQLVPVPCKPCPAVTNFYRVDCPIQLITCSIYPSGTSPTITSFAGVLGNVLTKYLLTINKNTNDCDLNSLNSEWFVDLRLNGVTIVQDKFFEGYGFTTPSISSPTNELWFNSLILSLDKLDSYGYDYTLTDNNKVEIYNTICSENSQGDNFSINVGINLNLNCN